MRIGMIADSERLTRERAMLNRICVGLIDEGAQILRLIPESIAEHDEERAVLLAERIAFSSGVLPWGRRRRFELLCEQIERFECDVLYAVGRDIWGLAGRIATTLEIPLAVDVWSLRGLPRISRRSSLRDRVVYLCATEPIADAMRARVGRDLVAVVPYGVPLPKEPNRAFSRSNEVIALAMLGGSRNVRAYQSMIIALSRFTLQYPQLRGVLELEGPNEHDVWRLVRQHGLLDRVSSIVGAVAHRRLLSQCDAVLLPEASGEVRCLVLELMAAGLPVLSIADGALDYLIPDKTALLIQDPTAESWSDAIRRLLENPDLAGRLGETARERIASHHRASYVISDLYGVFDQMLTGGAYSISAT